MTIFIDLDGTILYTFIRHIATHYAVSPRVGLPIIPEEEHWKKKREKQILWEDISQEKLKAYTDLFRIESERSIYLSLDTPVFGIKTILKNLAKRVDLVLVTKRYNRTNTLFQLYDLNLLSFFVDVLTPFPSSKRDAIQSYGYTKRDIVIGDTEEDIETANKLSLRSVAVSWGMRSPTYLASLRPTRLCHTVKQLKNDLFTLLKENYPLTK